MIRPRLSLLTLVAAFLFVGSSLALAQDTQPTEAPPSSPPSETPPAAPTLGAPVMALLPSVGGSEPMVAVIGSASSNFLLQSTTDFTTPDGWSTVSDLSTGVTLTPLAQSESDTARFYRLAEIQTAN